MFPTKVEPNADRATVRTEVVRDNGDKVPVSYSLRKTPDGWKAWDVVIEGISYVKSFREDFGAAIDQQGLDAVIERIEKGNIPSRRRARKNEACGARRHRDRDGRRRPSRDTRCADVRHRAARERGRLARDDRRRGSTARGRFRGVTAADSAGLAVCLVWLASAERGGRELHFTNLPATSGRSRASASIEALIDGA